MTQESIVISTTPPLPGLKMVQDINKALEALGTDFAGTSDPVAFAKPFMTWADTGNMLLKRRNAAGTAWVMLGPLLEEMAKKAGDASQRFKAAPSAAPDDVAVRSQVFGLGQTRQATSKTLGVNQTNTSGKMKEINILVISTTSNQFVRIRSVTHNMTLDIERSSAASQELPVSARILNGEVYVVEASLAYTSWLEMETSV